MKFNRLEQLVIAWAAARGILTQSTPTAQLTKTFEEVGEIGDALEAGDRLALIDGIGDTLVTLIIIAAMENIRVEDCLTAAYIQIKDRKGHMINGVFVKESDLEA